jgi:hypothetical protein
MMNSRTSSRNPYSEVSFSDCPTVQINALHIPDRAVCFALGGFAVKPDVGEGAVIKAGKELALPVRGDGSTHELE